MPDWAEQVTAIATAVNAIGLLGALELHGGFDFELIRTMLGRRLIDRWEMWEPSIDAIGGRAAYPMFANLVTKMRAVGV